MVSKKKWLLLAFITIFIVTPVVYLLIQTYSTMNLVGPSVTYASNRLDSRLLSEIKILDDDGQMSDGEKEFIETLVDFGLELIPKDVRIYYTDEELFGLQSNLTDSVLKNGAVDEIELQTLQKLKTERWYVTRDLINSGLVNEARLNDDSDKDGLSNIEEILQGTNPLNKLETNPHNLSERYVVIASTFGYVNNTCEVQDINQIGSILKRNGFTDESVFLILDPGFGQINITKDLPIQPDYEVKYLTGPDVPPPSDENYGNRVEGSRDAAKSQLLSYIKNLPSDENDLVLIYVYAHGNADFMLTGKDTSVTEINEVFRQIEYGEMTFIPNICHAGGFVKQLEIKPNMLAVGVMAENETGCGSREYIDFMANLNKGLSFSEALDQILYDLRKSYNPVVYCGRSEPFTNFLVFRPQEA
jgi:hypothetical protein